MPSLTDLNDWLNNEARENTIWYVKRLSANDTLANDTHQAGPYIPREFIFSVFPSVNQPSKENPDKTFEIRIDSHSDIRTARVVWYNNKLRKGTRNETRITNLGGGTSALLNPDNTGSLVVFSFHRDSEGETSSCHVWVCVKEAEEEVIEDRVGTVEPGETRIWSALATETSKPSPRTSCWIDAEELPKSWLSAFPSGRDLIKKAIQQKSWTGLSIDQKLIARRSCEYELFKSVEHAIELRNISGGFSSVDEFVKVAQTILQRRKSRSGKSLELHVREIFIEEGLVENRDFQCQPESEKGERPDFLFPSEADYKNSSFPANRLRMLGIKTTVKDRWAQVLKEASRVETKHLLTLQEGLSVNQFNAITEAKVRLVVPSPLIEAYHKDIRPKLITLENFIGEIKLNSLNR